MTGAINAAGAALICCAGAFVILLLLVLANQSVLVRTVVKVLIVSAVLAVLGAGMAGYTP